MFLNKPLIGLNRNAPGLFLCNSVKTLFRIMLISSSYATYSYASSMRYLETDIRHTFQK